MAELPPLTSETIWDILNEKLDDATVNQLVWAALGYRYDPKAQTWDISNVSPDWSQDYPEPPDFIGSRPATVKLTRSIPAEHKQLLKQDLGFQGYKVGEFSPAQARRATAASWLLSRMQTKPAKP
ncbi:MAG: DUF1823 family protein [Oscillatoriales cyanobacterium RM2_1_1]|nr:DUF1823 family protein [Oscillatoriales cyanobacterium SM2_3_0]NJO44716.1 DUF1823 family protein [Oscillatoriales cyanobacterium RM2_1_1]